MGLVIIEDVIIYLIKSGTWYYKSSSLLSSSSSAGSGDTVAPSVQVGSREGDYPGRGSAQGGHRGKIS